VFSARSVVNFFMNEAEVKEWTDFAHHLRRLARWDLERIDHALKEALELLPELEESTRAEILKLGGIVAERSSKLAIQFLRTAPGALHKIAACDRPSFLRWAEILAGNSREGLIEFCDRGPEILGRLNREGAGRFLSLGEKLAKKDWAVSIKYFLSIPKINYQIHKDNLFSWFDAGLALISRNPAAAMAYFSLESKQARENGKDTSPIIALRDLASPMKILVQAMTGRPMGIRSLREAEVKMQFSPGPWPFTDGEFLFLPEFFNEFSSADLNFKAFKISAAHQGGQVEFGTFSLSLADVSEYFPAEIIKQTLLAVMDREKPVNPLDAFFNLFPKRNLARDLFTALEGTRIDHRLRRNYRGLSEDMSLLLPEIVKNRPKINSLRLQEAFVEALLRLGALGKIGEEIPRAISLPLERMATRIESLGRDDAGVGDSARLTTIFYQWLARIPNLPLSMVPTKLEEDHYLSPSRSFAERPGIDFASRISDGEEPYRPLMPLSYRGELHPELVQKKMRIHEIRNLLEKMEGGIPLSPEALQALLENGMELDLEISEDNGEDFSQGLLVTDLSDLIKTAVRREKGMKKVRDNLNSKLDSLLSEVAAETGEQAFFYDEWDYLINDYRVRWCRLREKEIQENAPDFVSKTLEEKAELVKEVRKQFQMLKPERFKRVPHLERGDEIDLNEAVEAAVDRRAGKSPSEKFYVERNRKDRDFSTLFLVDMSASTDEKADGREKNDPSNPEPCDQKVIDIEKEALVVMAEALDELGDEYAIFGFSGYGRKEVDFFSVKDFQEEYSEKVKGRIGGLKAQRSTRMGTAIRHAVARMKGREQRVKNIILISDGYPQDYDYGEDRTSKEYALQDTMKALEEAIRENIHTFCITVDRAGHDYLRKMFPASRYLVIEETCELPRELPKIYRRLTS